MMQVGKEVDETVNVMLSSKMVLGYVCISINAALILKQILPFFFFFFLEKSFWSALG